MVPQHCNLGQCWEMYRYMIIYMFLLLKLFDCLWTVTAAEEGFASAEALPVDSFWASTAQQWLPAIEEQGRWRPGRDQTRDPCCRLRGVARPCTSPELWLALVGIEIDTWLPIRSVTTRVTVEVQQFLLHVKFWGRRVPIGQSNKDHVLGQEIYPMLEYKGQN